MTTIRDVARLAGVAPITVSRVINNKGYFTEETRERVNVAVQKLGYMPNSLARSLRSRKTHMLALILTDITNPFWTTVARGVGDAASEAGFNVILCNTDESEEEQEHYLKAMLEKQVDGVLLVPAGSPNQAIDLIHARGVPVVILDRRIPGAPIVDVVRCDSEGGAYALTQFLVSLGHRAITMLNGPQGISTSDDRGAGYCRALTEAKIIVPAILNGEFTLESGYNLAIKALAADPRPSALFAANNFIAIGALKALRDSNLRVPEDITVVGFDDLPQALIVDPFLTVASQPAYSMGHKATEVLVARLSGLASETPQEIILPTQIIQRRSTAAIKY
jgi:LacI family transcriptional regulator